MTTPRIVSREDWLAARKEFLAKEKEVTMARDALNAERRTLPMVRIDKEYVFEGRRQLIVPHAMFDPTDVPAAGTRFATATCHTCTTRTPRWPWSPVRRTSSFGSDFNYDFHVTLDESVAPVEYNYRTKEDHLKAGMPWYTSGELPGVSVFLRDGEDVLHSMNYLDLTPLGRQ
jgi:predicted dithiol-disulfide oxidoreductase (DUF899 family)